MEMRSIGHLRVGAIALGGSDWSIRAVDPGLVEQTVNAALDAGVTLIDSAHVYTTPDEEAHNERLIARILGRRERAAPAVVATKGGHYRDGDDFGFDGRPETIVRHCETSLRALGVECIELYQLHCPDPRVPVAETMGAFAELRSAGKIRQVGVCNVTFAELEEARQVVPIASVQNHLSPWAGEAAFRPPGAAPAGDHEVLATCTAEGIAFLAYAPFKGPFGAAGERADGLPGIDAVARERGVSRQQAILAWLLAQGPTVIPVVGANRPASIADSAAAATLRLSADDLRRIADPVAA